MEQQILFKVRDLRKKDQFKIDDAYLNGYARICKPVATAVYSSLCRHAEFHTQKAFPSQSLIAYQHDISVATVKRALKILAKYDIILIEQEKMRGKFKNNIYTLLDKSEWKKIDVVDYKQVKKKKKCLLCENTLVDNCHVIPKREGGKFSKDNIVPLCPNHHRMFDNRMLNKNQLEKIRIYLLNRRSLMSHDKNRSSSPVAHPTATVKRATKDNKVYKDNKYKKDNKELAKQSFADEINPLIELFKSINPSYERLFANKTQRAAIERIIKKFGAEKAEKLIRSLDKVFGEPFAPRITTPIQLESKLGDLLAYFKQRSQEKIQFIDFTKL